MRDVGRRIFNTDRKPLLAEKLQFAFACSCQKAVFICQNIGRIFFSFLHIEHYIGLGFEVARHAAAALVKLEFTM